MGTVRYPWALREAHNGGLPRDPHVICLRLSKLKVSNLMLYTQSTSSDVSGAGATHYNLYQGLAKHILSAYNKC